MEQINNQPDLSRDLRDQLYEIDRSFNDLEANGKGASDKPHEILKEFEWYLQMRTLGESENAVDQEAFEIEKKNNLARFEKFNKLYGAQNEGESFKVSLEELEAFVEKMREVSEQYE